MVVKPTHASPDSLAQKGALGAMVQVLGHWLPLLGIAVVLAIAWVLLLAPPAR